MPTDAIKVLVAGSDGVVLSEFLLGEGVHAIGAATGSAILIGGAEAQHAKLHLQNGDLFIEDLGTTAGIFIAQSQVTKITRFSEQIAVLELLVAIPFD